jgi:hypothetical protein
MKKIFVKNKIQTSLFVRPPVAIRRTDSPGKDLPSRAGVNTGGIQKEAA